MRRNIFLVVVSVVLMLVVAWLWLRPAPSQDDGKLRIGLTRYTGDLPFFVALDRGLFEKAGLVPATTEFGNSSEALNALIAEQVDVINPISFSALLALEAQSPGELRLFLPGGESKEVVGSYFLVMNGSPADEIADLRGSRIGTYTGATQLLYLKLVLQQLGLDPDEDVQIIQVGFNLQLQALETGQFDVLFTIEPAGTIALAKGSIRILEANPRVKYIVDPFISGAAAIRTEFLTSRRDAVARMLQVIDEAVDFIHTNESEARSILAKYTPLDEALAKEAPLLIWFKTGEVFDSRPVQRIADLLAEHELTSRRVDVSPLFIGYDEVARW